MFKEIMELKDELARLKKERSEVEAKFVHAGTAAVVDTPALVIREAIALHRSLANQYAELIEGWAETLRAARLRCPDLMEVYTGFFVEQYVNEMLTEAFTMMLVEHNRANTLATWLPKEGSELGVAT